MTPVESQITSLTSVYSTVYSRRRSKKTSKLRVTDLCAGNSPVTGEFPAQRASNAENVSIWWRHHAKWYFGQHHRTTCFISLCSMLLTKLHDSTCHQFMRKTTIPKYVYNSWNILYIIPSATYACFGIISSTKMPLHRVHCLGRPTYGQLSSRNPTITSWDLQFCVIWLLTLHWNAPGLFTVNILIEDCYHL